MEIIQHTKKEEGKEIFQKGGVSYEKGIFGGSFLSTYRSLSADIYLHI